MHRAWFGLFGLSLAVACSGGGGDQHLPPAPAGTAATGAGGGRAIHVSSHPAADAGAAGEAARGLGGEGPAEGGSAAAGEAQSFENAGAPAESPPGVCAPDMKFGAERAGDLGVAGPSLLAMTGDELSFAFTTGEGDSLLLHVADRSSTKADFVDEAVTVPADYEAESGVSLSSDGRRLILVLKDHSGFGELTRASRAAAFEGEPDVTAFAKINSLKPMSGDSVGFPVLSSDGLHLYFVSYFGQARVVESTLGKDGVFDFGVEIDPFTLGGDAGQYKLLSGLSSDERAIFFFDQATGHAMALFRSRPGAPFYDPLDLGARRGATPSQDCSRLYSSLESGLVVQTAK
jgi:hypothetical protein